MVLERISENNRENINKFIAEQWYTTTMIIRGKEIDMTAVEGVFASKNNKIIGLITYIIYDNTMEITSLDSLCENQGLMSLILTPTFHLFACQFIATKVPDIATERISAVEKLGFVLSKEKLIGGHDGKIYTSYYVLQR